MTAPTAQQQLVVSCATAADAALVSGCLSDPRSWGATPRPIATTNGKPANQFVWEPPTGPWQDVATTATTTVTVGGIADTTDNTAFATAQRALGLLSGLSAVPIVSVTVARA